MKLPDNRRASVSKFEMLWIWVSTVTVDAVFLALWLLSQFGIDFLIEKLPLSGRLSQVQLGIFQWVFLFSTLFPVVIYIGIDIVTMIINARMIIRARINEQNQQEEQSDKVGGNNEGQIN